MQSVDSILTNGRVVTAVAGKPASEALDNLSIALAGDRIAAIGPADEIDKNYPKVPRTNLEGRLVTPGLIDCHTHLVYGSNRAHEFELRLKGATYEEIARAGGGILSTVAATRAASEQDLIASALPRLDALLKEGVTTIEIKSGYGLDQDTEKRMLRAAKQLGKERAVSVVTTYLGGHTLPKEYKENRTAYLDHLCNEWLPEIAAQNLADAVDAFCEGIAFSPDEVTRIFQAAQTHRIPVRLHADQISDLGGANLAAKYHALSADHLECASEEGIAAMAHAGTVAVLLPGAFYFLREKRMPPIDLLRRHNVAIAVSTDSNPGSCPLTSLLLAMNMGATLFGLTVEECIAGVTREAAKALGRSAEIGTIEPNKYADLAIWNAEKPVELIYRMGFNPLHARIWRGQWQTS
ncbi:MAG: imidazolonepropionase [Alphaproteobacteria bacterium]